MQQYDTLYEREFVPNYALSSIDFLTMMKENNSNVSPSTTSTCQIHPITLKALLRLAK